MFQWETIVNGHWLVILQNFPGPWSRTFITCCGMNFYQSEKSMEGTTQLSLYTKRVVFVVVFFEELVRVWIAGFLVAAFFFCLVLVLASTFLWVWLLTWHHFALQNTFRCLWSLNLFHITYVQVSLVIKLVQRNLFCFVPQQEIKTKGCLTGHSIAVWKLSKPRLCQSDKDVLAVVEEKGETTCQHAFPGSCDKHKGSR